ncbi:hypothetical protein H2198_001767 [Neophaeococcomyces mojaviensis]|uniref:Uncharacterized protein n=1 Tax=Neophaeococcomyces mojaviensis TaxID=3383035 RepID=A0ACC3AG42_9EURO|nr:hypothetical protein H2198_001767 [Knufia sp. JES_112]
MTTHFDHYSYQHRPSISPPVSPKSLPHGYKRKASTQDNDDYEVESPAHISNSFKKLRLSEYARRLQTATDVLNAGIDNVKRPNVPDLAPVGVSYRDAGLTFQPLTGYPASVSQTSTHCDNTRDVDDYMPVDETSDRVWVHDLDAEIREIEAEEAKNKNGIQISEAGKEYSKLPEHILRQSLKVEDPAKSLQMVLYRDPISISVPQEEDAVRKAILEARRRMRERQHEERVAEVAFDAGAQVTTHSHNFLQPLSDNEAEDGMDID